MNRIALILDDEPSICMLLQEILKMKNIQSKTADTIEDARLLLKDFIPDFVFMDHRLPDGFGEDFIPELRHRCSDAKIIIMTAEEDFNNETVRKHGADQFLSKPFDIEKILAILENETKTK